MFNKKSQLFILSILFIASVLLFIYSYESRSDYYINSAESSLLDNTLYEICYIGNNSFGTNLTKSYGDFASRLQTYCSSFGYDCIFSYNLLPSVPANATYYDYEDLNLTLSFNSGNFNYLNRIDCTADYGAVPMPLYITIHSPENGVTYADTTVLLNISVEGNDVDTIWYSWDGEDIIYTGPVNVTVYNGEIILQAWVNNSFGNVASTSVTFNVEAPSEIGFNVYSEKFDWVGGGTSIIRPIGAEVKPADSFLIVYSAAGLAEPDVWQINGKIINSTHVQFERADVGDAYVSWFVAEGRGNVVDVVRGSIDIAAGENNSTLSIPAVDYRNSAVFGSCRVDDSAAGVLDAQDGYATLELINDRTVLARRATSATDVKAKCNFDVVEFSRFSGILVETGESNLTASTVNVPVVSMDMGSSWLYHTYDASQNGLQQVGVFGQVTSPTNVQFGRYSSSSYQNRIRWYLLHHTIDPVNVLRYDIDWNPEGGVSNYDTNLVPYADKNLSLIVYSSSARGTDTAFARNKNLPYFYDLIASGDNWRQTQYNGLTNSLDLQKTRAQIVEFSSLVFSPIYIDIVSPIDNVTNEEPTLLLNVSVTGFEIDSVWYSLNEGGNISYVSADYVNFVEGVNNLTVWANNSLGNVKSKTISVIVDLPEVFAFYDVSYGAPFCGFAAISPCVVNSSLLMSVDSYSVAESNQPNTVDSCLDGTRGTYLTDESVENVTVKSLNSTKFYVGDTVNVTAWVHCWNRGANSDNINFVYSNSTSVLGWKVVGFTDPCPAGGLQEVSTSFVLDNVTGTHAIRSIIQYNGVVSATCGGGDYDDNDDVVFKVVEPNLLQPANISIEILSPINQTVYTSSSILLNLSVSGVDIDTVWYNLNGVDYEYAGPVNLTLGENSYVLTAYVSDVYANVNSSTIYFNVVVPQVFASYSPSYGAPFCGVSGVSPCYANSSLLRSVDSASVAEPNQPNTVDSCLDGTSGTYLTDESVENVTVRSLNGSVFYVGDTVNVSAWVHCWDAGLNDNINFVYSNSTSVLGWKVVGFTDPCPAGGLQEVSTSFVLDNVTGTHAIRSIIQYNGVVSATCGGGNYDDNDDVVFNVIDYYPQENPISVEIVSPENGVLYNVSSVLLNLSVSGVDINNVWYNLNGVDYVYSGPVNLSLNNAHYVLTAYVSDIYANLNFSSVSFDVYVPESLAVYHLGYGAPYCSFDSSSPCVADSSLLFSVGEGVTPEPNQPNTIDACLDGSSGSYGSDESIENITITDLNNSKFYAGDTINVSAWIYCWNTGSDDNINFVYSNSTSSLNWRVMGSIDPCQVGGLQQVWYSFVLDNVAGTTHVIRVSNQYNGDVNSVCGGGGYDDNDDLVFGVN